MEETFSDAEEPVETVPATMDDVENGFLDTQTPFSGDEVEDYAMDDAEMPKFDPKPSHEAKIRELLRNISSIEVKLCADGSKEFMKLLRGSSGGELLYEYVRSSSKFTELLEAWNRWRGKPGLSYILSLLSVLLGHPDGKYRPNDPNRVAISQVLDKFSRLIIEDRLDDIYKELNSKEGKRQKAALLLLGSIVRRGSLLAAEVAKSFDFKLPILPKLSEYRRKQVDRRKQHSTRGAFVEFAMSFLEVGKHGLLRWVLQQREVFSGILRGLGNDDDETVVYVLSTLRDQVLTPESLIPPGLRSVLFGSVTLEQLVDISAREDGGLAAKVAYEVLVMVCTDPSNGLMPDLKRKPRPLKGNPKRMLGLMKKLRATEIGYHRDLLLAIVNGRPSLGSSYLDEFPYNLEDNASPMWLSSVALAANVVKSVRIGISWDFLVHNSNGQLTFENSEVQSAFKCVCPRPFSRLIINKGLQHSNPFIKQGTLRLLLEVLKLLSSFTDALSMNKLSSLKQKIQDEVRILLPDPQVLFKFLSSVSSTFRSSRSTLKRPADPENIGQSRSAAVKKLKVDSTPEDIDILVGGLDSGSENILLGETEKPRQAGTSSQFDIENGDKKLMDIWGSDDSFSSDLLKDAEVYLYCKVLEAIKIFHGALQLSYDFFKILPSNPLELPSILLHSLLSMLIEHINSSQDMMPPIYKHLRSFLNLSIQSSIRSIKEQAYVLAKAALRSSGAFDNNPWEIGAWLLFLPVYVADENCSKYEEGKFLQSLFTPVISFLCDAVSTIPNQLLMKYETLLKCGLSNLEVVKDQKITVNPFIICVMENCLKLLSAESGTFKLPQKTIISLYVCNTLKYLLQTQVNAETLAAVINQVLSERIADHICKVADAQSASCEWRPVVHLFQFSQSILQRETYICLFDRVAMDTRSSFFSTIAEVKILLSADSTDVFAISKALYFTTICTAAEDILENFPLVMEILGGLPGFHHYFMNYLYHDQSIMNHVSKLWPHMFSSGLGTSLIASAQLRQDIDHQTSEKLADSESSQHAAFVFGSYLKEAPFHILFPAVIFCGCEYYAKIKELLMTKLSNLTPEQIVSSLRLILFWFHQVQLSYRNEPSQQLECFFEICLTLAEHILAQLSTLKLDSRSSATVGIPVSVCIEKVTETVFCHPAVLAALSCPSDNGYKPTEILLTDNFDVLLKYCGERVCKPELYVLNLVSTTCDYLVTLCGGENSLLLYPKCRENILKAFRRLIQHAILIFKERFSLWCSSRDITFFQPLYAILALKRFISPAEILELANWMLTGKKVSNSMFLETSSSSPICLAFSMAGTAFDMLTEYLQPPNVQAAQGNFFWAINKKGLDAALFESIYFKALEFATNLKLDLADVCLLKSLTATCSLAYEHELLPLNMEMTRVISSTPIKLLSHCIYRTNTTRAKLLFLLTEISPLHLVVFGYLFLNILRKDFPRGVNLTASANDESLSDQDYLMLMPTAFSYISSSRTILREHSFSNLEYVLSFYSTILLGGFSNWKQFVSSTVFQVEYGNIMPSSVENLLDLFQRSLLGKAVNMLLWHLAITEHSMSKRLELLSSINPSSGVLSDFFDIDVTDIDSYSVGQQLDLVIRVIAKVSLSLALLFPEDYQRGPSNEEDSLRVRFLETLVSVWQWVVEKVPLASANSVQKGTNFLLLRSLEMFLLRCISRMTVEMHNHLIQMKSLTFVKKMAKVSLRHRFGDSTTLETLRCILSSLSDGKLPVIVLLQLLLEHSQLAATIGTVIESSNFTAPGMVVKPISSFLRSLIVHPSNSESEKCEKYKEQLEVIKLLRLLFILSAQQGSIPEYEFGVNWRELLLLLLASYGATTREIDLEVCSILSQIESARGMDHSLIADLDYLWGSAALRMRKELSIKHVVSDDNSADAEDCRRSLFRDNLPIDLNLLIRTILYFPYQRTVSEMSLVLNSSHQDNIGYTTEEYSAEFGRIECYDPVFLLSFSIHCLSVGYLDPVEFAGLGLLAIALVSMASPEEGVRKLGYEVLGRLKDALNGSQKKKEATRLKNLLAYFQNAIEQPWQKIPSIAAVFVAEASVILLDPSHDHYATMSKVVEKASQTKLSKINLESIPLFREMFWSSSKNFSADRIWMLRLLYAGMNSEDDGHIFIRNGVPDKLLCVYNSTLSNNEEKGLILQVLKKCVKLQNVVCYLIEKHCLVPWLSSTLSLSLSLADGQDMFPSDQLVVLLEVVHEIVSSKSTMEWLEKYALEQLSDLSCNLFCILVRCSKLVQKNLSLVVLVLEIIISALELLQKRKICQPHFTPSIWSLCQLYQAVHQCNGKKSSLCAEHGLKVILMNIPPATISEMGQQELSQFLMWAVATAIRSDSKQVSQPSDLAPHFKMFRKESNRENSFMSILLRWLVASVILWSVSSSQDPDSSFPPRKTNTETLLSLMEKSENKGRGTELTSSSKEALAVAIFHLQQLLGGKCRMLPSVVAALSILLLSDGSCSAGSETTVNCENPLPSLWSKIRYPPEANPAWRWSFYEPPADVSPEHMVCTNLEKMDELHACHKVLVTISGKLRKRSSDYLVSLEELESSGFYVWERTNLVQT